MNIINNPLFKICGILLIIYFALFHNKKSQDSLGNRVSLQNIKNNIDNIQDKTVDIKRKLEKIKRLDKITASCGDLVIINSDKIDQYNKIINSDNNLKIALDNSNKLTRSIIGMQEGEEKIFLSNNNQSNKQKVTLLKIKNKNDEKIRQNCP